MSCCGPSRFACLKTAHEHATLTLYPWCSFMTVEAGPTVQGGSGCLTWLAARRSMPWRRALFLLHLAALNGLSIAAATVFQTVPLQPARASPGDTASPPFSSWLAVVVLLCGWAAATLSLQLWVPLEYEPAWHIPRLMMPWVPSFALLLIPLALSSLPGGEQGWADNRSRSSCRSAGFTQDGCCIPCNVC